MTNGRFEHSDGDLSVVVRQLKDHMGRIFQKQPVRGTGTITAVEYHPTQGYPLSALATINGAPNQRLEVGANHRIVKGEVWNFIADEDNVGRIWVPRTCIVTDQGSIGVNYAIPLPVISVPASGMYVNRDGDYIRDASGGLVQTHLWCNFRAIVRGIYDLYGSHVGQVTIRVREFGETSWRYLNTVTLWPRVIISGTYSPVFLHLRAPFMVGDTVMQVQTPFDDYPTEENYILHQQVYWGIENETFEGTYDGIAPDGMITNITNRTPDSGVVQNHYNTDPSRPIQVTLFSGQIDIAGLSSSTVNDIIEYEMQIAGMKDRHLGPWSLFIPFEGYLVLEPPPHVTGYLVNQVKTGVSLAWTRPAIPHVQQFNIYRVDTAAPGASVPVDDTLIVNHASLPAGMDQIAVAPKNSDKFLVPVADPNGVFSVGNYYGVEVQDIIGNYSPVRWDDDNVPPPAPTGVTFISAPNGIFVSVNVSIDTAFKDEGFKEYVLYFNNAGSGTTGTEIIRSPSTNFLYKTLSIFSQTYYQLAAADWNNNISPLGTANWTYVASLYPQDSWPTNGNFQDPDSATPAPGTSINARPRFWSFDAGLVTGSTGPWSTLRYLPNGGIEGNRVVSINLAANTVYSSFVRLITSDYRTFAPQKTMTISFWVYSTAALTVAAHRPAFMALFDTRESDDGTGAIGTGTALVVGAISVPANTWTRISGTPPVLFPVTGRSASMTIGISLGIPDGTNPASTIYIDSVNVVFA